jgi:hypothetical protein
MKQTIFKTAQEIQIGDNVDVSVYKHDRDVANYCWTVVAIRLGVNKIVAPAGLMGVVNEVDVRAHDAQGNVVIGRRTGKPWEETIWTYDRKDHLHHKVACLET